MEILAPWECKIANNLTALNAVFGTLGNVLMLRSTFRDDGKGSSKDIFLFLPLESFRYIGFFGYHVPNEEFNCNLATCPTVKYKKRRRYKTKFIAHNMKRSTRLT